MCVYILSKKTIDEHSSQFISAYIKTALFSPNFLDAVANSTQCHTPQRCYKTRRHFEKKCKYSQYYSFFTAEKVRKTVFARYYTKMSTRKRKEIALRKNSIFFSFTMTMSYVLQWHKNHVLRCMVFE